MVRRQIPLHRWHGLSQHPRTNCGSVRRAQTLRSKLSREMHGLVWNSSPLNCCCYWRHQLWLVDCLLLCKVQSGNCARQSEDVPKCPWTRDYSMTNSCSSSCHNTLKTSFCPSLIGRQVGGLRFRRRWTDFSATGKLCPCRCTKKMISSTVLNTIWATTNECSRVPVELKPSSSLLVHPRRPKHSPNE